VHLEAAVALGARVRLAQARAMKILIVSTPKTGNTWLKSLLAAVYGLPVRNVGDRFDAAEFERLGTSWVTHQHYHPQSNLVRWARENGLVFVTTIRHPADVLVSLSHYTVHFSAEEELRAALRQDGGTFGPHVTAYIQNGFYLFLNQSISWMQTGLSHVVRYEELWQEAVPVLLGLTRRIREVPETEVERAVRRCDFDVMRRQAVGGDRNFFRRGGSGSGLEALPLEIVRILAEEEPYPAQFAALGYRMDPSDPWLLAARQRKRQRHPFVEATQFDNGVPVTPILIDCYLCLSAEAMRRWPEPTRAGGSDSFFAWLNDPSPRVPATGSVLSNLAVHIHDSRPDLRAAYPELGGTDCRGFAEWFVGHARQEYGLDEWFIRPVEHTLREGRPPSRWARWLLGR
jgi:hypothetical protein